MPFLKYLKPTTLAAIVKDLEEALTEPGVEEGDAEVLYKLRVRAYTELIEDQGLEEAANMTREAP